MSGMTVAFLIQYLEDHLVPSAEFTEEMVRFAEAAWLEEHGPND